MAITTGLSTHQSEPLMTNNVTLGAVVVSTTGLIITVHRLTIFTGFARNQWNGSSVSHISKSYHIRGPTKCDCCSLQLWKRSNRHCNLCNFVVYGFLQFDRRLSEILWPSALHLWQRSQLTLLTSLSVLLRGILQKTD